MQQIVILGAGRSRQFVENPTNIKINLQESVLDWQVCAFDEKISEFTFVGGYQFDKIAHKYSNLHFVFNPQWDKTACDVSLQNSGFSEDSPAFVTYGDILFRSQLIQQMLQVAKEANDVVIAIDEDVSLLETKENCEFVVDEKNNTKYPFIGCVYLKPAALKTLKKERCFCDELKEHRFSGIINGLQQRGFKVAFVKAHNLWTEVSNPIDVARFVLTTKAQTLYALRKHVKKSRILEQIHFSTQQWFKNKDHVIDTILKTFSDKDLVVRSSSLQEDSFTKANAGKFESVLNVSPEREALTKAITEVIHSYGTNNNADLVLVQPMLHNVNVSGVVFTRTLNYGAPYYVVNYDKKDTAAITSGASKQDETFYHWKYAAIPEYAPCFYKKLFAAIQEIEVLTQFDALDIEFAVTNNEDLYIFQVRPIVSQHLREVGDHRLSEHLECAKRRFEDYQTAQPDVQGEATIFGVMPDWNPAEIVGTKPHRLAISLYQTLITNDIWAQQRAEFGYKNVRPYPLIINFVGHPYVDVRASIHSFLPNSLSGDTTRKLVNFYVNRLRSNPEWHDKLEFMVMPTCHTADFKDRWHDLLIREAKLSESEYQQYEDALFALTKFAFEKCKRCYEEMREIEERFTRIADTHLQPLDKIYVLMQTCKEGTLNFSHLARCGFIASSFLKSFVAKGIVSEEEKTLLTENIQTITGQFFEKTQEAIEGKISREDCIQTYGHLRPGTYDITSPTYRSDPDKYLFCSNGSKLVHVSKSESSHQKYDALANYLRQTFDTSLEDFKLFLDQAIAGREYSKFVFTKYISMVLDLVEEMGKNFGFTTKDMAHLPINVFEDMRNGLYSGRDVKHILLMLIEQGKEYYRIIQSIELPPLITRKEDFYGFFMPKVLPNFIGNKSVETEIVYLKNSNQTEGMALKNKIVLIKNADPGFDWIFNYEIGGLITAYGGPNSHMAIRAAEFKLPASIGVGETLFDKLKWAQFIQLDCASHKINIIR